MINWLDLFAVQRTLKSLLQHHSSKTSVLPHFCMEVCMIQVSHLYMTTGRTIALTEWTFVRKVMSLLFNMLSRFIIAFLSRSKCLLISWLQSPSTVILEPKKIKSVTDSTFPLLFAMKWQDSKSPLLLAHCIESIARVKYSSLCPFLSLLTFART